MRTVELDVARRGLGASVLKPLLCWAAADLVPFADRPDEWAALAEPAITASDNAATATIWTRAGGGALLAWLDERIGATWHTEPGGEHPSLRVMVTADELAHGYARLAADRSDPAVQVQRWMRAVRPDQTFGLRAVAAAALGVDEGAVGVKCGWFGGERAHAVVLIEVQRRTLGAVVMTHSTPDAAARAAAHAASSDDARLAALHDALAGDAIRSGVRRALVVAASR